MNPINEFSRSALQILYITPKGKQLRLHILELSMQATRSFTRCDLLTSLKRVSQSIQVSKSHFLWQIPRKIKLNKSELIP